MPKARTARQSTSGFAGTDRLRESGLGESFGFLVSRAGVLSMGIANEALSEFELSAQELMVLAYSTVTPPPAQRELATVLLLDPSRIVGLVDQLEARGVVARTTSQADRRIKEISATEAGRELVRRAMAALERVHAAQTAHIDPQAYAALTGALRAIALD